MVFHVVVWPWAVLRGFNVAGSRDSACSFPDGPDFAHRACLVWVGWGARAADVLEFGQHFYALGDRDFFVDSASGNFLGKTILRDIQLFVKGQLVHEPIFI
jgi:hypothetical protein